MAELNEEPNLLPSKRRQPAENLDAVDDSLKKQCLETTTSVTDEEKLIKNGDKTEHENEVIEEDDEEDYEGEDEIDSEEEEEEDNDDEIEHSNGGVDRKGKGIMKDDKGKGKMIEESDSDSDSDSESDGLSDSDGDDDLSDPLAEIDLDNILPSRTRRHTVTPGLHISNDKDNDA